MSTICPVAEDGGEETGGKETKLPEDEKPGKHPEETTAEKKSAPKNRKPDQEARKSRRKPFEIRGTLVPIENCTLDDRGFLTKLCFDEEDIILPEGIKGIGKDAFLFALNTISVVVPRGATTIEGYAFQSCYGIRYVFLPSTLRTIEDKAFYCCSRMKSILIPEGCTEIGAEAFCGCDKLKNIYLPASLQKIGTDAFRTWNPETIIHAPSGSIAEAYAVENGLKADSKPAPTITVASGVVPSSTAAPIQDESEMAVAEPLSIEMPLATDAEPFVEEQPSTKTLVDEKRKKKSACRSGCKHWNCLLSPRRKSRNTLHSSTQKEAPAGCSSFQKRNPWTSKSMSLNLSCRCCRIIARSSGKI